MPKFNLKYGLVWSLFILEKSFQKLVTLCTYQRVCSPCTCSDLGSLLDRVWCLQGSRSCRKTAACHHNLKLKSVTVLAFSYFVDFIPGVDVSSCFQRVMRTVFHLHMETGDWRDTPKPLMT